MRQIDVVGAVIQNDAGEILCAQRSQQMSHPLHWEFPGGKIEPGERPEEALVREIQEELGCAITVGDLVADVTHPYPAVTVRLRTYWSRLMAGSPVAREHAQLRWLPPNQLGPLTWAPADLPTVARLTQPTDPKG